ncbi:hypothetical protein ACI79C_03120 [Geodermatophilus sp. SYSU D00697]
MPTSSNPSYLSLPAQSALMPAEVAPPQAMLVTAAIAVLREHRYEVRRGTYADLDTAEVAIAGGRHLVLLPMAETMWGGFEDPDIDVWHLMVLDAEGEYLEFPLDVDWPWHCPSVLWAHSLGLDPAVAVFMVQAALADDHLRAHFGLSA